MCGHVWGILACQVGPFLGNLSLIGCNYLAPTSHKLHFLCDISMNITLFTPIAMFSGTDGLLRNISHIQPEWM